MENNLRMQIKFARDGKFNFVKKNFINYKFITKFYLKKKKSFLLMNKIFKPWDIAMKLDTFLI